jgi:uncharacterized repeat protein (TIGR01451 family)
MPPAPPEVMALDAEPAEFDPLAMSMDDPLAMPAPPAPPGLEMPMDDPLAMPAPPAPPGLEMPMDDPLAMPAPPAPPGLEMPMDDPLAMPAPPAPPGLEMPMDDPLAMPAPPAPPGLEMPMDDPLAMPAPPAPPGLEMPMDDPLAMPAPPAPPGLDLLAPPSPDPLAMPAPPAPPGLEMPMDDPLAMPAPPAPPGLDLLAPPSPDPLAMPAPPAPPGLEMPMDDPLAMPAPPAPPGLDLLAPPSPDPLAMPAPPAPPGLDLLAPPSPDPLALAIDGLSGSGDDRLDAVEEGVSGVIAGAVLRSVDEVDSIAGDKLRGSIVEVETTTVDPDGHVTSQKVEGTLTLLNPSETDRVYDVDAVMANTEGTSIGATVVNVEELEPGQDHVVTYVVKDHHMLALRERFDSNPARDKEASSSLAMNADGNTVCIEVDVQNLAAVTLHDVEVRRPLPAGMVVDEVEHATVNDGDVVWSIGTLDVGAQQTMVVRGTITVEDSSPIASGSAVATYRADAALSTMSFDELDAFCRGFAYMKSIEGERPDSWEVTAVFENRSSFAVDLVKLQARLKGSDELLFDFHDVNEDVAPHGEWRSESVSVDSAEKPDLTWELSYTVLPRTSASTKGTVSIEARDLVVVDGIVEKSYSRARLHSYREQSLEAEIRVKNNGSADINLMRITDDVPGLFNAVDPSSLKVKLRGEALPPEQFKAELSEGLTLEREFHSPDGAGHTLSLTVGRKGPLGMKPGDEVVVTYNLVAPDPSPANERVDAPCRAEFSCERYGPMCERDSTSAPSVHVVHNRRNFSAGKQVLKVGGRGRYEVLLLFANDGDTPLADVKITDIVPAGYTMKDVHITVSGAPAEGVETTMEEGNLGTTVVWHLQQVGRNERVDLQYQIAGEGEIDTDLLNTFHGAVFGDEIEDASSATTASDESAESEGAEGTDEGEEGSSVKFRDDVLDRVMETNGISMDDRDAFIAHAAEFDHDQNGYLKKQELEDAAAAWNAGSAAEDDHASDDADGEADEAEEGGVEARDCPICQNPVPASESSCVCGFSFES